MFPLAELAPWTELGAGGLVAMVAVMVFTGRLMPSGTVAKLLTARDERIEELKKVLASEQERNCRQADQITALLESGRTTAHVLEEFRKVAEKGPGESEDA